MTRRAVLVSLMALIPLTAHVTYAANASLTGGTRHASLSLPDRLYDEVWQATVEAVRHHVVLSSVDKGERRIVGKSARCPDDTVLVTAAEDSKAWNPRNLQAFARDADFRAWRVDVFVETPTCNDDIQQRIISDIRSRLSP